MIRSCCACQTKQPASSLLRLYKDDVGLLQPTQGRPLKGRSAWVCCKASCILTIVQKPKKTFRSLRSAVNVSYFVDSIYIWLSWNAFSLIHKLHRDGVVHWKVKQNSILSIQYWITLQGEFAKSQKIEYFKPDEKSIPPFRISLTHHTKTRDMMLIGVQSGKTSKLLQQRIHLLDQLKPHCSAEIHKTTPN